MNTNHHVKCSETYIRGIIAQVCICNTVKLRETPYSKFELKQMKSIQIDFKMTTCATCNKKKPNNMFDTDDDGEKYSQCKLCRPDPRIYTCAECLEETPYNKMRFNRGKLQKKCGECCRQEAKVEYQKNRQKRIEQAKDYVEKNKEKTKQYKKVYNRSNQEKTKAYNKVYREVNRERLREQKNEYNQRPYAKMRKTLHSRLLKVLTNKTIAKTNGTISLLGCRINTFLKWMEFQFTPYMSWENHGEYWHIDHCKPCNSYDLLKESEQKKCFHWTNLQPLPGKENISKSDNYTDWDLLKQEIKVVAFKFKYKETFSDSRSLERSLSVPLTKEKSSVTPPGKLGKITYEIIFDDLFDGPDILITYRDGKPIKYESMLGHGKNPKELDNPQPSPSF